MRSKKTAHFWGTFGASAACLSLFVRIPYSESFIQGASTLGFGTLIGAIAYLQYIEWRKERQKLNGFAQMKASMKKNEEARGHGT